MELLLFFRVSPVEGGFFWLTPDAAVRPSAFSDLFSFHIPLEGFRSSDRVSQVKCFVHCEAARD